jgi:hypothetical protein
MVFAGGWGGKDEMLEKGLKGSVICIELLEI